MPLFGLVYWYMPHGSFYAPYAKLESSARDDTRRIASAVEVVIKQHFASLEKRRIDLDTPISNPDDDWRVEPNSPFVVDGSVDGNQIKLTFAAHFVNRTGLTAILNIPVVVRSYRVLEPNKGDVYVHIDYDYNKLAEHGGPVKTYLDRYHVFKGIPLGQLDFDHRQLINSYVQGYAGDPLGISDSLSRMIYFSVVTITIVGFGDIVPMTTRTCAALEAIVGILLAGLFINAVGHSRARDSK
jgi:Ion channel